MERTVAGIGNTAAAGSVARATGAASATVVQPVAEIYADIVEDFEMGNFGE